MAWIGGNQGDAMHHLHAKAHISGMEVLVDLVGRDGGFRDSWTESFRILISTPTKHADSAIASFARFIERRSRGAVHPNDAEGVATYYWSHHRPFRAERNIE